PRLCCRAAGVAVATARVELASGSSARSGVPPGWQASAREATGGCLPARTRTGLWRGENAQIVCASDACYTRENMDRDVLPKVLWNASVMSDSLAALRKLRDQRGATMFYGHDPAQWETVPRAPAPVI